MIDPEVWQGYDSYERQELTRALAIIAASDLLSRQIALEESRVINGDTEQSDESLMNSIREYRAVTRGMQLVHDYGLQLLKESENE